MEFAAGLCSRLGQLSEAEKKHEKKKEERKRKSKEEMKGT